MRQIGRILLVLVMLAFGAWLASVAWPRIALYLAGGSLFAGEDVRTATAYLLPPGKDVEFVLARQPSRARIAVAALSPESGVLPPEAGWRVAWTALDEHGAIIDEGVFTGACRAPATYTDHTGTAQPARWSANPDQHPCADQMFYLRFADGENAARVRLRLDDVHPNFHGISVRVAQRVKSSRAGNDVAWHRLNDAMRAERASFNAYPAYLLTPGEIVALTANEWTPVGPQGVAGNDFGVMTIAYLPVDLLERDPLAVGITRVADGARNLTLPLFEGGDIALRLAPVDSDAAADGNVDVDVASDNVVDRTITARITWHPILPWSPSTFDVQVPPGGIEWKRPLGRGLLEIAAPLPLAVDVVAADTATMQHEEHRLRVLRLDDGQTADWPVSHAAGLTTALRLDVRGYVENSGARTVENDALSWQWLDSSGGVVRSGSIAPQLAPSLYDLPQDDGIVTDPASVWFRLPDSVATLRVIAHGKLLASASSRVDDATLPRRVPAEQRAWFDDARRIPEWFGLDPSDWSARVSAGSTTLLRIQHRPLPPTRLGADALVDVMAPQEKSALAARVVLPLAAVPFKLAPLAGSLFAPIDKSCRVQLLANRGEARVLPQLLFTGGNGVAPATVVVDGVPLDLPAPAGNTGTIDLPPLAAGAHRICVEDRTSRRWYTSHAASGAARLIEGGGYWLESGGAQSFVVHKNSGALTLNVRWYGSDRAATTPVLRATVDGIPARGAFTGYTLRSTTWTLSHSGNTTLPGAVLYRAGARVAAPQAMNLTLDTDLPAGDYRVRFALAAGNPGYLAISRLDYAGDGATRVLYEAP